MSTPSDFRSGTATAPKPQLQRTRAARSPLSFATFGQLTYEMWRAVRLVVDTGMHAMKWDRQRAIDCFKTNAAKTEHDIAVEIDRYIVWPGQALAYKLGQLKIQELRARAKKELKDKFDIRRFHDAVLLAGALPLDALEKRIEAWTAAEKARARRGAPACRSALELSQCPDPSLFRFPRRFLA